MKERKKGKNLRNPSPASSYPPEQRQRFLCAVEIESLLNPQIPASDVHPPSKNSNSIEIHPFNFLQQTLLRSAIEAFPSSAQFSLSTFCRNPHMARTQGSSSQPIHPWQVPRPPSKCRRLSLCSSDRLPKSHHSTTPQQWPQCAGPVTHSRFGLQVLFR